MHAVFFGIKVAHLRVLDVTRLVLRGRGLTPARFDMMRIVELYAEHGVGQQRIQDLLAVSAATVSRMLKALEELGYVVRDRMDHDARMRRVLITDLGLERVREARIELIESGLAERMALRGLDFNRRKARRRLASMRRFLSSMRKVYLDKAPFEHPWTLQDLMPPLIFTTMVDGRLCYGEPFTMN